MRGTPKTLAALLVILILSGCASQPMAPADPILGSWQSDVAGFTINASYTADAVSLDDHSPVPYSLDGDRLTIGNDAVSVRIVSFPERNEMAQLDPLTGSTQRFIRSQ
jgi:hypothetical protein